MWWVTGNDDDDCNDDDDDDGEGNDNGDNDDNDDGGRMVAMLDTIRRKRRGPHGECRVDDNDDDGNDDENDDEEFVRWMRDVVETDLPSVIYRRIREWSLEDEVEEEEEEEEEVVVVKTGDYEDDDDNDDDNDALTTAKVSRWSRWKTVSVFAIVVTGGLVTFVAFDTWCGRND